SLSPGGTPADMMQQGRASRNRGSRLPASPSAARRGRVARSARRSIATPTRGASSSCLTPPSSASAKHWCALLGPGLHTFLVVIRGAAQSPDGGERVAVEGAGGGLVDRAFEPGDGERRIGGQSRRQRLGAGHQIIWRHDLIEIANEEHFGRIDRL